MGNAADRYGIKDRDDEQDVLTLPYGGLSRCYRHPQPMYATMLRWQRGIWSPLFKWLPSHDWLTHDRM